MKRYPELIGLISRLVALGIGQVGERMAPGRAVTHDLIAWLLQTALRERSVVLRAEPVLIRATKDGVAALAPEAALARLGVEELRRRLTSVDLDLGCPARVKGANDAVRVRS